MSIWEPFLDKMLILDGQTLWTLNYFDDRMRLAAFTLKHSIAGMHVRRHLTSDSEGGRLPLAFPFTMPFVEDVRLRGPKTYHVIYFLKI